MESQESMDIEYIGSKQIKRKNIVRKVCNVPLCSGASARSFHRFPKNEEMRQIWGQACLLTKPVSDYMYVCSNHFMTSDFIPRWDQKLRRLKSIAVPSLNLPIKHNFRSKKSAPSIIQKRRPGRPPKNRKRFPEEDPLDYDASKNESRRNETVILPVSEESNVTVFSMIPNIEEIILPDPVINENSTESTDNPEQFEEYTQQDSSSPVSGNLQEHDYCNLVCKCERDGGERIVNEVTSVRVLMELNEIAFDQVEKQQVLFGTKDIMLKVVEEFYFATRRFRKATVAAFIKNDHQVYSFTGIDNKILDILTKAVMINMDGGTMKFELGVKNQIILCLMRIRLSLSFRSIATLFCISQDDCAEIFDSMIPRLKKILVSAIYWPTKSEMMNSMPDSWESFKKTVSVIDSTGFQVEAQLYCQKCGLLEQSGEMAGRKFKIHLGFSEYGLITYIGKAKTGAASDEVISDPDCISQVLVPSDNAIMTNGCFVEETCNRVFIELIKLRTAKPFSPEAALRARSDNAGTHIEKAFKQFSAFRILQKNISPNLVSYIDDFSVIISGIVNLNNSVLTDINFN